MAARMEAGGVGREDECRGEDDVGGQDEIQEHLVAVCHVAGELQRRWQVTEEVTNHIAVAKAEGECVAANEGGDGKGSEIGGRHQPHAQLLGCGSSVEPWVGDGHVPVVGHHRQQVALGVSQTTGDKELSSTSAKEMLLSSEMQFSRILGVQMEEYQRSRKDKFPMKKYIGVWSRELRRITMMRVM